MYIQENSELIINGEAQFWMVPNYGSGGFPVNAGLSQLNEMIRVMGVIRDKLAEHVAARDIEPLFNARPDAVDRLLDDVQMAPHLPDRERECMAALHGEWLEELDSNGKA